VKILDTLLGPPPRPRWWVAYNIGLALAIVAALAYFGHRNVDCRQRGEGFRLIRTLFWIECVQVVRP